MYEILIVAIAAFIGYHYRTTRDLVRKLEKEAKEPKTEIGATLGQYGKVNEFSANQDGNVGLVEPKTPAQLDWEEQERLREANFNVKVK